MDIYIYIYRLMKAFRKCISSKTSGVEKFFKLFHSAERLISFLLIFLLLCHVSACLFYLIARIEGIYPNSWVLRYNLQDSPNIDACTFDIYIYIYILDLRSKHVLDYNNNHNSGLWRYKCWDNC